jgi:hypothetical protein
VGTAGAAKINFLIMEKFVKMLIVVLSFVLVFLSCNKTKYLDSNQEAMLYVITEDYSFFYNREQKEFYLIQYKSKPIFEGDIYFNSFDENTFAIKNKSNIITFNLMDGNIFGITKLIGFEDKYLSKSDSKNTLQQRNKIGFTRDVFDEDFQEKLYCKCRDNKLPDNNCTSGGKGSTECEQSVGNPVVLMQSCSTKCDTKTSYACCWAD